MKKVVIGCSVLRREIEAGLEDPSDFKFNWLEDQLHNVPETLHEKVQSAIDAETGADRIYLLYGHCGQAMTGIQAKNCPVVLPKVEDCIDVLLCHNPNTAELRRTSYFVSQGWLWGEEGLGYEYDRMKEKYGEKRALRVIKAMYKNYKYLMFVKTGVEDQNVREKCAGVKLEFPEDKKADGKEDHRHKINIVRCKLHQAVFKKGHDDNGEAG